MAHWHLLLSSLPLLSPYTPHDNLVTLASEIITALYQDVDGPSTAALTVGRVLKEFMTTSVFQEMTHLHDPLLVYSITHEQASLPKWCVLSVQYLSSAKFVIQ